MKPEKLNAGSLARMVSRLRRKAKSWRRIGRNWLKAKGRTERTREAASEWCMGCATGYEEAADMLEAAQHSSAATGAGQRPMKRTTHNAGSLPRMVMPCHGGKRHMW
jgi:hypothetical protein